MVAPTTSDDFLDLVGLLAERVERGALRRDEAERPLADRAASGCPHCRRTFDEVVVRLYGPLPGRPRLELWSLEEPDNDQNQGEAPAEPLVPKRRRTKSSERRAEEARQAVGSLQPLDWGRRRERVSLEWFRFRTSEVAALFLDEALACLPGHPEDSGHWAELALLALAGKRLSGYPDPAERVFLRLRARLFQANTARIRGELQDSATQMELTLSLAESHEVRDLVFWAEAKVFMAALRRGQRAFDEASRQARASAALFRAAGQVDWEVRTRWQLTAIYEQQGDYVAALAAVREALPAAAQVGQPVLEFGVRHSEVTVLARLGRFTEAEERYEALTPLAAQFPDRSNFRSWTRGFIAAGLGRPAEAEAAFRSAREGFLADENAYDAALVTLDWSLLLLEQGRADEVLPLAISMGQAFEALGVARETLASWAIFQTAAERHELTRTVAEALVRTLGEERTAANPKR